VYLALHAASEDLGLAGGGLVDAGYYALDAMRIEAGRRAWGAELGPDETPLEAGAMFAVKLDKAAPFIGQAALRQRMNEPLKKKLVVVVMDDASAYAWGGEPLRIEGASVGEITSAGWSEPALRCIALGYVRGEAATRQHAGGPITVDVWGEAVPAKAWDRWSPTAAAGPSG